jgi:type I restriction enzyme S subunit
VLVTEGAGSLAAVGASAVWHGELAGPVCFQNTLLRLRPRAKTDARFLAWWSRYAYSSGLFAGVASGANIFHLSAERVRALPAWLPSRIQQTEIADFLDAETARIDALIEKKRRRAGLLEERRRAVIADAVSGHRVDVALRRLFRVVNGGTPTSDEDNWHGEVPWATPVDLAAVDGGKIASTARSLTRRGLLSGSAAVPAGSLILSTRAPIGYVVETIREMAFNQGCRGLVPRASLDLCYFRYQLVARRADLVALGQGSTFTELSSDALASFKVACPSLAEQREIADRLEVETVRIDALVEKTRHAINLLREHRQALITAAVTGQLDVASMASTA